MNLEYKLNKHPDEMTVTIYVEDNIVNQLYFIILMQFDYFIRFLLTMFSDIHDKYPVMDIAFPVFQKNTLQQDFSLRLFHTIQTTKRASHTFHEPLHSFQQFKHVHLLQNDSYTQLVFKLPSREEGSDAIHRFSDLLETSHKKYICKLLKCVFDKLFLKLLQCKSRFHLSILYHPFQCILEETTIEIESEENKDSEDI